MASDPEKVSVEQVERTVSQESNDARIAQFTPQEQRKIIHRVDRRLVTTLGALYACSLMDRTNLGAVNIAGYVLYHFPLLNLTHVIVACQRTSNCMELSTA
ncbi:MAG: hypothetical protein CL912_00535 [Deltaproteobacteria bacterium]|nr:hypothetical protein [Deltaproteobacteria bacterium]